MNLRISILLLLFANLTGAWTFSWSTRTDVYGKPAGIFATTPFPLSTTNTTYNITNDEGVKVFNLGTFYYVDGAVAADTGDGSWETPFKTISHALNDVSAGNKTILVRGSHNSFDGTYNISSELDVSQNGTGDTNRYTISGYEQERPIVNFTGTGGTASIFHFGYNGNAYCTLQRMRLQNARGRGVYITPANYVNIIDVDIYFCANEAYSGGGYECDGNFHTIGTDNGWVFHCTSGHTYGKGIKIADGVSDWLVEWSYIYETGYWTGIATNSAIHPYGLDFATDNGTPNDNLAVRYCIIATNVFGNEFRNTANLSFHHNEVFDPMHYLNSDTGDYAGVAGLHIIDLGEHNTYGDVYANIFHDNTDPEYPYLLTLDTLNNANPVRVFNNLFYGSPCALWYRNRAANPANLFFVIANNTFYGPSTAGAVYNEEHSESEYNETDGLVRIDSVAGTSVNIKGITNNIFYTSGNGKAVDFAATVTKNNNLYYYPNGSRGYANPLESGGMEGDPFLSSYTLTANSTNAIGAGVVLSFFTDDLNGIARGALWDIGAYEYQPPTGATITAQRIVAGRIGPP